jgi:hypothetical protein
MLVEAKTQHPSKRAMLGLAALGPTYVSDSAGPMANVV